MDEALRHRYSLVIDNWDSTTLEDHFVNKTFFNSKIQWFFEN